MSNAVDMIERCAQHQPDSVGAHHEATRGNEAPESAASAHLPSTERGVVTDYRQLVSDETILNDAGEPIR